jgi:SAM-dependent methyltransferase
MRLNLGCGNDIRPGYTNVDFRKTHPSVVEMDLSKFAWDFESESADEILMLDFLEHFPYRSTMLILLECYRILKPDGELVIQVPDGVQTSRALIQEGEYLCNTCGTSMWEPTPSNPRHGDGHVQHSFCPKCGMSADEISKAAMMRLYGGQDYVGNYHQTVFTSRMLEDAAEGAGFKEPRYEEEEHMWKEWTIKCRFKKGDMW